MNIDDIENQLAFFSNRFPEAAIQAAMEQREAVTPMPLDALEAAANAPVSLGGDPVPMLYMYALYLLRSSARLPMIWWIPR